jgi:hypothetical protein
VNRLRFSDEWIEKVENWSDDPAAMIKRYDALRRDRQMQTFAQELKRKKPRKPISGLARRGTFLMALVSQLGARTTETNVDFWAPRGNDDA